MGIKQEIEHTKTLLNQGVDLLLLRLQVINLDLAEQAENAFRTLLALLFSAFYSSSPCLPPCSASTGCSTMPPP